MILYFPGIIKGIKGSIIDSTVKRTVVTGVLTTIGSGISVAGGLLLIFLTDSTAGYIIGPGLVTAGATLFFPGIVLIITGVTKDSVSEYEEEKGGNIELSIREEDGAIGFSW